ncbi:MAG: tRNA pseudouridine(38-40) synthase TruA [Flavobacteriales bacterium]|nr:tRNA pseudouridine(38-40) synthase TruA [Flavobacteriales bacterium]OUW94902.1 MAG: tRNA pseudouridine(38-40) synthase TruA [Flavobacteriales bacterium TMED228]
MRYFIDISYDGSNYHGWQIQPNADTVQHQINLAFSTILNEEINVLGAGRTDTGVHAKKMIAHFDTNQTIDFEKFKYRINGFLKNDISLNDIYKVKEDAHARFSAISRTYEYRVSRTKNPFSVNSYFLLRDLDFQSMKKACKFLHGSHDYTSFAKLHSENYTNNCEVFIANWKEDENLLIFTIKANRFLRNMVRAIVGTLIEIGEGKISFSDIETILMSKDRAKAGYSVPANGLSLIDIEYPKEILI